MLFRYDAIFKPLTVERACFLLLQMGIFTLVTVYFISNTLM
jgi:hypothetical protein